MFDFGKLKISTKISLLAVSSIIIFCLLIGGYFSFFLNDYIGNNILGDLRVTAEDVAASVNLQNNQIENSTSNFADRVLEDFNYSFALEDRNYLNQHIKSYFDYEKNLLGFLKDTNLGAVAIYMVYNVEDLNGVYETWFVVDNNGAVYNHPNESFETFNSLDPEMDWYYAPKKSRHAMWTDVYEDSQTRVSMISYVVPLYDKDRFVGITGVDVSLTGEQNYVNSMRVEDNGDVFLLDKKNNFITKNNGRVDFDVLSKYFVSRQSSDEGFVFGSQYTLFFKNLFNGTSIISVIPNSYRENQIYWIVELIVVLCLVALCGTAFFSSVFSKRIVSSLNNLQIVSKQLSKGNFDVRADVKSEDEIGDLAKTFNKAVIALQQSDQERKQVDKLKTEFLSITSHELRSPMTPMRAQLQMLLGGYFGKLNVKQKDSVDIVLRNTVRLDKILFDFLEISRIEAARLKFTFVKTNLMPHIKRVVEELIAFMPEKKVDIDLKMDDLPDFEVDPDRTMQVLRNLINNAVKFVPDKGGKIFVSVQKKEDCLLFSVKDNGVGIAAENKRRIFEPFFQEEQTMYRKYQGTGLGLAICRGIIESQKGSIWFDSVKGKGTTFYFTVPFTPVREIASIKVLFSGEGLYSQKVLDLFKSVFGPLGEVEFNNLLKNKGISKKAVLEYIKGIYKDGVLPASQHEEFINKLNTIYSVEEKSDKLVQIDKKVSDEDIGSFVNGDA